MRFPLQTSRSGNETETSDLEELHAAHNEKLQARMRESKQRQDELEQEVKALKATSAARASREEQINGAD